MIDQLLDETESQDAEQTTFKVVRVRLGTCFFSSNDSADQPIFKKGNLSYDKQQLAKVISYQQFQLLFRPFKNHPSFKKFVWQWKFLLAFSLLYVVLTICMIIFFDPKYKGTSEKIFGSYLIVSTFLFLAVGVRSNILLGHAKRQLKQFCKILSIQQNQVSFRMVTIKKERAGEKYVQVQVLDSPLKATNSLDYIYVYSKRVMDDNQYIKLYKNSNTIFSQFRYNEESHIYQEEDFQHDSEKLNRIISFDQFQRLLRPFNRNYNYRRRFFWVKFSTISFFSIILLVIPLLIWIDQKKVMQIIFYSYTALVFFFTIFGAYRALKMQSHMLRQLKDYCFNISLANKKIEIILHLKDTKEKQYFTNLHTQLYCFQIRQKEHERNRMA